MLGNSFDIPAYKFAIIKPDYSLDLSMYSPKDIGDYIVNDGERTLHFIPFEYVDGLTLEELKQMGFNENLVLVCYASYDYVLIPSYNKKYYKNIFEIIPFKLNDRERIDEALNNLLVSSFSSADDASAKIICCFLERYCYKSMPDVLRRIREHKESNK